MRRSRTRTAAETLGKLIGMRPLRCRDCHTRFVDRTWELGDLTRAHCPRCYHDDLSFWNQTQFVAPNYMLVLLRLGANPYFCEYCRFYFVSFRRRKQK